MAKAHAAAILNRSTDKKQKVCCTRPLRRSRASSPKGGAKP